MRRAEMDTGMSHTAGRRHAGAPAARRPRQGDRHVLPGIRPDRPRRPGRRRRPRPVGACRVAAPGRPGAGDRRPGHRARRRADLRRRGDGRHHGGGRLAGPGGRRACDVDGEGPPGLLPPRRAPRAPETAPRWPTASVTPSTITSLTTLEKELALIRDRGYAVCRGEFESPAWGVSAPVLDLAGHPVAVVSVWGPSERLGEERIEALGAMAIAGAAEIAGRPTSASA